MDRILRPTIYYYLYRHVILTIAKSKSSRLSSLLNRNIPEPPAYGVLPGFVRNMKIFCSEDLFRFKSYWIRDIFHGNFKLLFSEIIWSSHRPCWHIWHFYITYVEGFVHQLWHMTGFRLYNSIVTSVTCGAGNAHSFRNTWFHAYGLMTLVCLPGLVWLLWNLFYFKIRNISLIRMQN